MVTVGTGRKRGCGGLLGILLTLAFLVIAGFAAEACVNYTYNGAGERGFHAVLLKNAVVSYTERYVRFVLETSNDISYFTLQYMLEDLT